MTDAYTIGIEEEYFLVDAETKMVAEQRPEAFFAAAKAALGPQLAASCCSRRSRSRPSPITTWRPRTPSCAICGRRSPRSRPQHGLAILAAGTHPTAAWETALQSPADRYDTVMHDLQMIGQRNMLCGLHVHVELPDSEDRVDVMCGCCPICRCSSRSPPRRRSGGRARPGSRAIGSPPMTSCRARASRSCFAEARISTPISRR